MLQIRSPWVLEDCATGAIIADEASTGLKTWVNGVHVLLGVPRPKETVLFRARFHVRMPCIQIHLRK